MCSMLLRQLILKYVDCLKKIFKIFKVIVEIKGDERDMINVMCEFCILDFEKGFKEYFCVKRENLNCRLGDNVKFVGYDNDFVVIQEKVYCFKAICVDIYG